tara:strand:+ start:103 stop:318 length:216 start_codon:yes stop_codon:yes gene_type:complete
MTETKTDTSKAIKQYESHKQHMRNYQKTKSGKEAQKAANKRHYQKKKELKRQSIHDAFAIELRALTLKYYG